MNAEHTARGFGLIFYFFEDPGEIRRKLVDILTKELAPLVRVPLKRVMTQSGRFKDLSVDWTQYIGDLLQESSFRSAEYERLTSSTADMARPQKLVLLCGRIEEWFPKKKPNYVFLAVDPELDRGLLWNAFKNSFLIHSFHLAFGGPVLVRNEELLPAAGASTTRAARAATPWINEPESTWMNRSFLAEAGNSVDGPVEFLGLGPHYHDQLALDVVRKGNAVDLGDELGEDYILFRMPRQEQLVATYALLRDRWATYDKPQKYWKADEWREWREQARREVGFKED